MPTQKTENKTIQEYPFFHLLITFLLISSLIISAGSFYLDQYKGSIKLVSEHLTTAQAQLSEQTPKNQLNDVNAANITKEVIAVIAVILVIIACCLLFIYRHSKRYLIQQFQLQALARTKVSEENDIFASQSKINAIATQKNYAQLYSIILQQSEHLALTSLNHKVDTAEPHLFEIYLLTKVLATRTKQAKLYRYMQAGEMVLKPSKANLLSTTQAILLNQIASMKRNNNELTFEVDGDISPDVHLDVEVFSEMMQVFTELLCDNLSNSTFHLNLQLLDKSDTQQNILVVGKVDSGEKIVQLPKLLQTIQDQEDNNSEIIHYFDALLHYLHSDNIAVQLIDIGYQFSFSLPVAAVSTEVIGADIFLELIPKKSLLTSDIFDAASFAQYQLYPRPLEVLIGVNSPIKYQVLQHIMQTLGFQVTFVAQEMRQEIYWQSGRYVILITEFSISPFVSFSYEESSFVTNSSSLPRGVFCLKDNRYIIPKSDDFSHWKLSSINTDAPLEEIINKFSLWLSKTQISQDQGYVEKTKTKTKTKTQDPLRELLLTVQDAQVFDINQYIKNQGTAELAFFMLDEYLSDANSLTDQLAIAVEKNDLLQAEVNIILLKNIGKILATDDLLKLCNDWQKHLSGSIRHQNKASLNTLLSKTREEISNIEAYANAI